MMDIVNFSPSIYVTVEDGKVTDVQADFFDCLVQWGPDLDPAIVKVATDWMDRRLHTFANTFTLDAAVDQ